jgi:hypothetical protein
LVEQPIRNRQVTSSSLVVGSIPYFVISIAMIWPGAESLAAVKKSPLPSAPK